MYLYFDKFGTLKEIINDGAIRLGDSESDKIYIYFEDEPVLTGVWLKLKKPDDTLTNDYSITTNTILKEIPYDKDRDLKYFQDYKKYKFYYYSLTSDDLSQNGLFLATIRAVNGPIKAQGLITFNVENGVVGKDEYITQSQFDYLLKYIADNLGEIQNTYVKEVDYSEGLYEWTFKYKKNNLDEELKVILPFKDIYTKIAKNTEDIKELRTDLNYNHIGLLDVSDYNEDTGEITYVYNGSLIRNIDDAQLEDSGIITIYVNPIYWEENGGAK